MIVYRYVLVKEVNGEKHYLGLLSEFLPNMLVCRFGHLCCAYIFAERRDVMRFMRGEDGKVWDDTVERDEHQG